MKLELKHIAPYLPHGLKCHNMGNTDEDGNPFIQEIVGLDIDGALVSGENEDDHYLFEDTFPILRPLSDLDNNLDWLIKMAEDVNHVLSFHNGLFSDAMTDEFTIEWIPQVCFEWLVENHFDVFSLIPAGLAISYKDAGLV